MFEVGDEILDSFNNLCFSEIIIHKDCFKLLKEGVYINELNGMHAGMNAQSGNFSLQAAGFMIRDGKLAEPLSLITVAGNLVDVFMGIKDIANNSEFQLSGGVTTPSILIKKLSVTGE